MDILCSTDTHPTAEWIYERARQAMPNISLGTVYRNLRLLAACGAIMELNYGKATDRFDGNPKPHYHFVCESCGAVTDVSLPLLANLEQDAEAATGALITAYRLEFSGICADCRRLKQ